MDRILILKWQTQLIDFDFEILEDFDYEILENFEMISGKLEIGSC